MNRYLNMVGALVLAMGGVSAASALEIGGRVKDFQLSDTEGRVHQLYKMSNKNAVVLMTQGNGCPIARLAMPSLREIKLAYASRGVEVFLINPNLQDTAASVTAESKEFGFEIPILMDKTQMVSEGLGVNRNAEIFVINPKTWQLVYRGPVDDSLSYEKQRPVQNRYLVNALDAVLAGKPVAVASVNAAGCLINFPNRR